MRSLTDAISKGFIWSVGITRPKPGQEHLAAVYITGALVGTIAFVIGILWLLLSHLNV